MNQTQGVLLFGLGFALFLGWLWKYPEEQVQDKNDVRQDVGTREGPALLKWVEDNGLEAIKGHLENLGKRFNTPNVAWQRLGLIADVKVSYLTLEFV